MPFVVRHGNIADILNLARQSGTATGTLAKQRYGQQFGLQERELALNADRVAASRQAQSAQTALAFERLRQQQGQFESTQAFRGAELAASRQMRERALNLESQRQTGIAERDQQRLDISRTRAGAYQQGVQQRYGAGQPMWGSDPQRLGAEQLRLAKDNLTRISKDLESKSDRYGKLPNVTQEDYDATRANLRQAFEQAEIVNQQYQQVLQGQGGGAVAQAAQSQEQVDTVIENYVTMALQTGQIPKTMTDPGVIRAKARQLMQLTPQAFEGWTAAQIEQFLDRLVVRHRGQG